MEKRTLLATGLATAAFFAFIGGVPWERWKDFEIFLLMIPIVYCLWLVSYRKKRPGSATEETRRIGTFVVNLYSALMFVAVALCIFVLKQGTLPAALIGLLPALPCFYGAWRLRLR